MLDITTSPFTFTNPTSISDDDILDLDYNRDYTKILACGKDKQFRVLNATDFSVLYESSVLSQEINSCSFTYDANHEDTVLIAENTKVSIF